MDESLQRKRCPKNSGSYQRAALLFAVFAYWMILPLGTAYLSYDYIYRLGNAEWQHLLQLTVAIKKQFLMKIDKYIFSTLAQQLRIITIIRPFALP